MKRDVELLITGLLIGIVLLGGILYHLHAKPGNAPLTYQPLPKNLYNRVVVASNRLLVQTREGKVSSVIVPRTGKIAITTDTKGNTSIEQPSWVPTLCVLPHLGTSLSQTIEPSIGLQFLRSERLLVGVSLNATPSRAYLSIDRDIFRNSLVSANFGYEWSGRSFVGIGFSLYF